MADLILPSLTPGYSSNMDVNNANSNAIFAAEAAQSGLGQSYIGTENAALGGGYNLSWNGQPLNEALGLGTSNPAAALGQPLNIDSTPNASAPPTSSTTTTPATNTNSAPTSLKTLFTGSLINVVFIVVGTILMALGGAMMVSRNA